MGIFFSNAIERVTVSFFCFENACVESLLFSFFLFQFYCAELNSLKLEPILELFSTFLYVFLLIFSKKSLETSEYLFHQTHFPAHSLNPYYKLF